MNWQARFEELVSDAADRWHSEANRLAMSGLFPPFYLFHKPASGDTWGELYLVPETSVVSTVGVLRSCPEPAPRNATRQQIRAWLHERAKRLPLIGA